MNTMNILQELKAICAELEIQDAHAFTFRGVSYALTSADADNALQASHLSLIQRIGQQLYDQCYVRDTRQLEHLSALESQIGSVAVSTPLPNDLTALLIQANATKEAWDRGWKIYQIVANGKIFVQKAERSRAALAGTYVSETMKSHGARIGDLVSLRIYPANSELQVAFFHSFGSQLADQFDDYSAVRLYFNINPESATALMANLSSVLNKYYVPFHFKTLVDPRQYGRADAAVLYIARRYYQFVLPLIEHFPDLLGLGLHDPVPMFCHRIMRGVGVAEDPGTGESFGMHRCRIIAEGLVVAWEGGLRTIDERFQAIQARFQAYDLILEKPYLNPFSVDIFASDVVSTSLAVDCS